MTLPKEESKLPEKYDGTPRYNNLSFSQLVDRCGRQNYDVVVQLDDKAAIWVEVLNTDGNLVTPAELVSDKETFETASKRLYERLIKDGKITRPE